MKLWKKVYLFTLIAITVVVDLGFMCIINFTYNQMLQGEKKRSVSEFKLLHENISSDIANLKENDVLDEEYYRKILRAYNSYYESDTQLLGYIEDTLVVGDANISYKNVPKDDGILIRKEEQTTIWIIQKLYNTENYSIVMKRTLYDFDSIWEILELLYIVGGIILSLGVSLLLALIVRFVLKPMDELESVAKQMQKGEWSARVNIKGNNELAHLGQQFNNMAKTIEENIVKLELQSEQKQELINNLAHEMNTPITSIQGFVDYMRISVLSDDEKEECLEFITAESKRLKQISTTLLSMASIESQESVPRNTFSILDMCNRLEELYAKQLKEESISFSMKCEVNEFDGNEALIESLLRNLINNARQALNDKENAKIDVCIVEESHHILMKVTDNGCGISEKHISQIFEPFYRVDRARSRSNGGAGLGLAFCKKIVEIHNGNIEVTSELNKGTQIIASFTD